MKLTTLSACGTALALVLALSGATPASAAVLMPPPDPGCTDGVCGDPTGGSDSENEGETTTRPDPTRPDPGCTDGVCGDPTGSDDDEPADDDEPSEDDESTDDEDSSDGDDHHGSHDDEDEGEDGEDSDTDDHDDQPDTDGDDTDYDDSSEGEDQPSDPDWDTSGTHSGGGSDTGSDTDWSNAATDPVLVRCNAALGSLLQLTEDNVAGVAADDHVQIVPVCQNPGLMSDSNGGGLVESGNADGLHGAIAANARLEGELSAHSYQPGDVVGLTIAPDMTVLYVNKYI